MAQMHKKMAELIVKQLTGEISEEEKIELDRMRASLGLPPELLAELLDRKQLAAHLRFLETFNEKTSWKKVKAAYNFKPKNQIVYEFTKQAALIIPLAFLTWLFIAPGKRGHSGPAYTSNTILPKNNRLIEISNSDIQTFLKLLKPGIDYVAENTGNIESQKYGAFLNHIPTVETIAKFVELQNGNAVTVKENKFIVHF